MTVEDEALHLTDKVRNCGRHLDLLLRMEQATQMDRSDLHRAVSAQYRLGWSFFVFVVLLGLFWRRMGDGFGVYVIDLSLVMVIQER